MIDGKQVMEMTKQKGDSAMNKKQITQKEIDERGFSEKYTHKCSTIALMIITVVFGIGFSVGLASAGETKPHYESDYVEAWCNTSPLGKHTQEYLLPDKKRIDCFIERADKGKPNWAIEFDFSYKWAEAFGQSLYYGLVTKSDPAVALIQKNYTSDKIYAKHYRSLRKVADGYNIKLTVFCIGTDGKDMDCPTK